MRFCLLKSWLCVAACLSVGIICAQASTRVSVSMREITVISAGTNKSLEAFGVNWLLICLAQWPVPPLSRHILLLSSREFFNMWF